MSDRQKPSDDAVVLAIYLSGRGELYGDDVRRFLGMLGFDPSPQWVSATLRRLAREDSPMVEGVESSFGLKYRPTRFGHCQLDNRFAGFYSINRASAGARESE